MVDSQSTSLRERVFPLAGPVLGLALFALALGVLRHELRHHHLHQILAHLRAIPAPTLGLATALTVLNYLTLTCYDALAFRYIEKGLAYSKIALSSFIGYAFSNNVGLAILGGSAVRYRLLSAWGLKPGEIARVIAFTVLTFWIGFLTLGGLVLTVDPVAIPAGVPLPFSTSRPIGLALLVALAAYIGLSHVRRQPLMIFGFEIPVPRPIFAALQMAVSSVDIFLAAGVAYALLPHVPELSFWRFLGIYLTGTILGLLSHVPAGLGVFETVVVVLLRPYLPGDQVLASILAYRVIYYLLPFLVGLMLLGAHEVLQHRHIVTRLQDAIGDAAPQVISWAFAVVVFIAGLVLLASGAVPPDRASFKALAALFPLSVLELSHFLTSIIGMALVILARGLQRRVDSAYVLTLALLAAGAGLSLLRDLNYEQCALLVLLFVLLLPCRDAFYRHGPLLRQPITAQWVTAMAIIVVGLTWLVLWSYRHVEYANELWWRFELSSHAPRSMRATVGAVTMLVLYAAGSVLRPSAPEPTAPQAADLDLVRAIVRASPSAQAYLAFLGDKTFEFSERRTAFVMYGIEGRTWVSMGDPVGPAEERVALLWQFRELCDRHGGWPAFYEVREDTVASYVDLGLTVMKLGESACVPLDDVRLEGSERKFMRQSRNRMAREGCDFTLVPTEQVAPLLDDLAAVSNAWLAAKHTREKGFSLGRFDRSYLRETPIAIVRRGGRLVAFANVWASGEREELSIDLMRYTEEAPPGVMDYLFTELMLWGQAEGYRSFVLGMAPMAGLESRRLAPLWHRLGALLFAHGEHFYNFQGLRQYKDKFKPIWEPRYLACPGGTRLPVVLTNIATLISGGVGGVVKK